MPNKKYAEEWLRLADQHYNAAKALNDSNESKNIIGIEIQQAIEKYLKALLAYHKDKIPRTHDLIEIYEHINKYLKLNEDEKDFLDIGTDYFTENRYPGPYYSNPPQEEIIQIMKFTKDLKKKVESKIRK